MPFRILLIQLIEMYGIMVMLLLDVSSSIPSTLLVTVCILYCCFGDYLTQPFISPLTCRLLVIGGCYVIARVRQKQVRIRIAQWKQRVDVRPKQGCDEVVVNLIDLYLYCQEFFFIEQNIHVYPCVLIFHMLFMYFQCYYYKDALFDIVLIFSLQLLS